LLKQGIQRKHTVTSKRTNDRIWLSHAVAFAYAACRCTWKHAYMLHLSLSSSQSIRSLQAHSQDPVAPTPLAKRPVNSALVCLLLLTGFLQVLPAACCGPSGMLCRSAAPDTTWYCHQAPSHTHKGARQQHSTCVGDGWCGHVVQSLLRQTATHQHLNLHVQR
jgi:hypothetical protein